MSQPMPMGALDSATLELFERCVASVMGTMAGTTPRRTAVEIGAQPPLVSGLAAMVGITGAATGVVVLGFPTGTAVRLAGRMLGSEGNSTDDEVSDAMAELANMVGGSAKAKLAIEPTPDLSLPTVVSGENYRVCYPSNSAWVCLSYESDLGSFSMQVSLSRAQ